MQTPELPAAGQVIKTKSGDKTWKVLRVLEDEMYLEGTTNFKFKTLAIDQYHKSWKIA